MIKELTVAEYLDTKDLWTENLQFNSLISSNGWVFTRRVNFKNPVEASFYRYFIANVFWQAIVIWRLQGFDPYFRIKDLTITELLNLINYVIDHHISCNGQIILFSRAKYSMMFSSHILASMK